MAHAVKEVVSSRSIMSFDGKVTAQIGAHWVYNRITKFEWNG
jgi:hypothetical protein